MSKRPVIALLAAPETSASVLYGLYDVLFSVGAVYPDMVAGTPGEELLDVRIVSEDGNGFHCLGNVPVEPHAAIDEMSGPDAMPDAVIVCDLYTSIHATPSGRYPHATAWLRQAHANGALVCSVCSGALLLADAGLLDGREATAHWAYRDMFGRHYPKVRFRSDSVLCLTTEADRLVTAGGVSAWHDLAVYLIARFCGYRHAIETAKVFLISGHSDGQSPYAVMTRPMDTTDAAISDCQAWIANSYDQPNPVEAMVSRSGLNARTFSRRFRAATGYAPIDYVQALRIEEAKQALETDSLPIEEVSVAVGYEDAASFRRIFKRRVGLTPAAYRRKFQRLSQIAGPTGGSRPAIADAPRAGSAST
ncbi:helix-turn-helix domain-containing protein [Defluviimonas sp. WL0002]|uniref:Helix-turn-helix domain-containing protein n=1 Tax=Albidovulum marisflavi TaxID=2984159 RepID=A0ABT2ZE89_9RHOB|nr:helix-turn-helix domain-containing protein [Defluviimonas sp. WL0002]MCV2869460.1 helix-turn-helix domain-containing protein [Defluviimonas sp. WL0002]